MCKTFWGEGGINWENFLWARKTVLKGGSDPRRTMNFLKLDKVLGEVAVSTGFDLAMIYDE